LVTFAALFFVSDVNAFMRFATEAVSRCADVYVACQLPVRFRTCEVALPLSLPAVARLQFHQIAFVVVCLTDVCA